MRIGLFTDQYYPSISGVVTSIKMLYEGLEAMGHKCFIFTSYDEKFDKNNSEKKTKDVINFKGKPYPFKNLKDYRYTLNRKKCAKIVGLYNLDIIHVHTEYSIAKIAMKSSKMYNIPIVHTLHTLFNDYLQYVSPFFNKYFHKQMLWGLKVLYTGPISKKATIQIVPTVKVLATAKDYGFRDNAIVKIIPTGIELSRFYNTNYTLEELDELKKNLKIDGKLIFIYVGRVSEEKNIKSIVKAYSMLDKKELHRLLIIGGGPQLDDIKNYVKELNICDNVIFTGFIPWDIVPKYYQLADVFVNASLTETQGLTNVEALASSLPVLVQNDDSIKELIKDNINGIIFNGIDELYGKMKNIIDDSNILKNIRNNAFESVKHYSKEEYSNNIYNVYLEAININK